MSQAIMTEGGWSFLSEELGLFSIGADFYRRMLDELNDGVFFIDNLCRILYWNRGAERLTGHKSQDMIGLQCGQSPLGLNTTRDCQPPVLALSPACPMLAAIRSGLPTRLQMFLLHRDGHQVAVDVDVSPIRNDHDQVVGSIAVFRDASSQVELEQSFSRLREQALNDPLTGLANRRSLDVHLEANLELMRKTGTPFSLIMADLDRFKWVNDTYGHLAGDLCLKLVANSLKQDTRCVDLLGRFGGEEFLLILPRKREYTAFKLAERLRLGVLNIAPPELLGGVNLTSSFGVAEARPGDTAASAIERVDKALYLAKASGRNCVVGSRHLMKRLGPHQARGGPMS